MILYDTNMFLSHTFKKTNLTTKFLIGFSNEYTLKSSIYNCNLQTTTNEHKNFHFHFKSIVKKIPTNYPTIILGDFNITCSHIQLNQ
jgi:hypothetical protein